MMLEVTCLYCKGTGRAEQFIGHDKLGRAIRLPCECQFCQGHGKVFVNQPSKSWRAKADAAQRAAREALRTWTR